MTGGGSRELGRRDVGPVQVLESDDDWSVLRHPLEQLSDGGERAVLQLLGGKRRVVFCGDAEQRRKIGVDPHGGHAEELVDDSPE